MKEIVLRKNVRFSKAKTEYSESGGFSTKSSAARRAAILLWTILICAGCMMLTTLAFFNDSANNQSNSLKTAVFEASTVIKDSQNETVSADPETTPQLWSLDSGETYTLEVKPGTSKEQASTGFVLMHVSYTNDSGVLVNKTYYTPAIKKDENGFNVTLMTCCNVSVSFEKSWGNYSGGGISLDRDEVILGASDALVSFVPDSLPTAASPDNSVVQTESESPSDPPLLCSALFSGNETAEQPVMAAAVNETSEETVQSDSDSSDTEMIVVDGQLWLQPKDSTVTANVSGTDIKVQTAQMQMSDGTNQHSGAFRAYFPVLDQVVSILDYADGGQGEAILYDGSTTTMPAGLSVADVSVILPKAPVINYYDAENTFAEAKVIDGKLVYVSPKISTYCDAYAVNVTYCYQDNAGSTYYYMVQYQADAQVMADETLLSAGTELQITEAEAEKQAEQAAKQAEEAAKTTAEKNAEETVQTVAEESAQNTETASVEQQTGANTDASIVDPTVESGGDSLAEEAEKPADEEAVQTAAEDSAQNTESTAADQQAGVDTGHSAEDTVEQTPSTIENESSGEAAPESIPDVVSAIAEKLGLTRTVESLKKGDMIQAWNCSTSSMTEQAVAVSAKYQSNTQLNQFILTFEDGRQLAVNGHMVFYDVTEQQYVELNGNNWDTFAGRTLMALDADGQMIDLCVTAVEVQQVSADCYNVVMDDTGIFANGVLVCDPAMLK